MTFLVDLPDDEYFTPEPELICKPFPLTREQTNPKPTTTTPVVQLGQGDYTRRLDASDADAAAVVAMWCMIGAIVFFAGLAIGSVLR